jgi:hypothetical protein
MREDEYRLDLLFEKYVYVSLYLTQLICIRRKPS